MHQQVTKILITLLIILCCVFVADPNIYNYSTCYTTVICCNYLREFLSYFLTHCGFGDEGELERTKQKGRGVKRVKAKFALPQLRPNIRFSKNVKKTKTITFTIINDIDVWCSWKNDAILE
jgi:hypothetical protein